MPGKPLEIFLDVGAGFLARDAELIGEPERRDAIDDAEIDRLGAAAHFARHVLDRHAEHFRRRHGMNVEAVAERFFQRCDVGDLGQQSQLDLRVVRRDELLTLVGDEGAADLAALFRADRNVLQVRLGRRQPAGGRRRQRVRRVNAMRIRIDEARQRIGIGRFQFRHLSPIENFLRQFVAGLRKLFQHGRAGRPRAGFCLGAAGKTKLAEQNIAELLRDCRD